MESAFNPTFCVPHIAVIVPFLLQDRLVALGGRFEHGGVFQRFAARDSAVTCGQNPASSKAPAGLVLEALSEAPAARG